jgi:hypothetical protein
MSPTPAFRELDTVVLVRLGRSVERPNGFTGADGAAGRRTPVGALP